MAKRARTLADIKKRMANIDEISSSATQRKRDRKAAQKRVRELLRAWSKEFLPRQK